MEKKRYLKILLDDGNDFEIPILPLVITAFIATQIRSVLEFFTYRWETFEPTCFLLHLPLFFFSIFLTTAVVFSYLANCRMIRSVYIFLLFMPIIIMVPLIDMIVYGSHNRGIYYVEMQQGNILMQFLNIIFLRGSSDSISIGQYLLVHISAGATAFLCWFRTQNIIRCILMWFAVLFIAFFYVTLQSGFTNVFLLIKSILRQLFEFTPYSEIQPIKLISSCCGKDFL